ncbi:FecR family protein [Mucilaginibacter gracilis]|uniref:FecR family protein n=1 Tax=Mucilaginibacter gracilis TaxID=423350 RepID=A0A495IVQ6_9SPHI|nr:FecR domain-containing protein [Mucilaginibacter gracilis]RKR80563.1 FecR family protein [Mucilaginibacter gracilis]
MITYRQTLMSFGCSFRITSESQFAVFTLRVIAANKWPIKIIYLFNSPIFSYVLFCCGVTQQMKDQIYIKSLFKKYLDVECTRDEINELFKLISKKENEELFNSLIGDELSKDTLKPLKAEQEDKIIIKVKSVILSEIRAQMPQKSNPSKFSYKIANAWLKIAALWLVIGSATLFLFYRHFRDSYDAQIKNPSKQLVTQNGQRKLIKLFDGTKIWLCPSSTLNYEDQLVNSYRVVSLDGEAFFEVAKDKKHPFIIHSGRMQTQVVGTSFNIKSDSKLNTYSVTVVTGIVKVAVMSAKSEKISEVTLKPKQQIVFNKGTSSLASKEILDLQPVIKKRDGILSYDGTPVGEVVADLKKYYDVPIELENRSAMCLCYGEFDTNRPIKIVLSQLAAAIGANVVTENNKYTIVGGCDER